MSPSRWSLLLLLPLLILPSPAPAATRADANSWCGTNRSGLEISLAEHRDHLERLRRQGVEPSLAALARPAADQVGDVAVLVNDGTLVHQPNPFDLAGTGINVTRKKNGVQAAVGSAALSSPIGTRLELTDDWSVLVPFPRGFRFPFFGKSYTSVFVNSDGNLTFGAADYQSTERSVARFLNGPPRIAPFFADLDPGAAGEGNGVFSLASKTKIVITWQAVPEYGKTNANTFQVTLTRDGRITIAYGITDGRAAVVGLAPGNGGQMKLLDYSSALPTPVFTYAFAERFGTDRNIDDLAITSAFLQDFADDYDQVIIWLDFQTNLGGGAFAYEFSVKNEVRGLGQPVFDSSSSAGSHGRLRSVVEMGTLSRYPTDPDLEFLGTNSTMDVLGQESGHRWLTFFRFRGPHGEISNDLLGRDLAHWSFNMDSDASDMEGNDIRDNGDGTFTSVGATSRYNALDMYAMGLIAAAEVPPFWYVADSQVTPGAAPLIGVTFGGRRVDLDINDIVAAEGPRVPSSATAPKSFNLAFIIVSQDETPPSATSIAKVETFRNRWVDYWIAAVDGRGSIDTTLRRR